MQPSKPLEPGANQPLGFAERRGLSLDGEAGRPSRQLGALFCLGLLGLIILGLVGLLGRCAFLQLSRSGRDWQRQAQRQHTQIIHLSAKRGSILDRQGLVLAADVHCLGVFADPEILTDPRLAAGKLAAILAIPSKDLLATITQAKGRRFVWLQRDVSQPMAQKIQALHIRGLGLQSYQQRIYPQGWLAGHLLGFVGFEGIGLEGLERQFEPELAGRAGYQERIADPYRRALWSPAEDYRSIQDGANLVLTIDSVIQHITEEQLSLTCQKYQAKWGVALVMDPNNGEILAMANWPTFAPEDFRTISPEGRRNRCLTDVFEPGSTFKCFIASKALEAGLFRLDEQIFCHNGIYRTGSRTLHDHGAGFGTLSFEDVVVNSSNIGMAIVGQRLGNARLYEAARAFGFGQQTGIRLAGESPGIVAPLDKWTSFSTTSLPMGQEISVTAVQLLRAFCAIANDGLLYRPTVVRAVISPSGEVFWRNVSASQPQRVLRREIAQVMRRQVLANVVERGTGRRAKLLKWRVFGKTGTSQVAGVGGYVPDAFVGSFLGGAPLNEPRVCVLVSIGQPNRSLGYYGGTVAAPAVGSILSQTLGYMGVPPEPPPQRADTLMVSTPGD